MQPVIDRINTRFTVELTTEDLFTTHTTPHKLATAVATKPPAPADAEEAEARVRAERSRGRAVHREEEHRRAEVCGRTEVERVVDAETSDRGQPLWVHKLVA